MIVLRIEHKVQDFEAWRKAFESDPIDRKKSGVKRYRIYRPVEDSNYVVIDLEFESVKDAETALDSLHKLWKNVEGKVIFSPLTRILEVADTFEYT